MRTAGARPLLGLFVMLAHCGSGDSSPARPVDAGDDAASPDVAICTEAPEDRPSGGICVRDVKGSVIDTAGKGLGPGLIVTTCGGICFFGKTEGDGTFDTNVGTFINPARFAVLVHGRPDHASLHVALPKPSGETVSVDPIKLPSLPAAGTLMVNEDGTVAGSIVSSGEVTLKFPAGTYVDLDIEDVALKEKGRQLRVTKVPLTELPPFAKGSNVAVMYALSPYGAHFLDGPMPTGKPRRVGVSLPNPDPAKLLAGAAVELVIVGDELLGEPFTGGLLLVQASGKVSSDGTRVETDVDEGITRLTWLGVRPKP